MFGVLLDKKQLEKYMEKLASDHNLKSEADERTYPIPNLTKDFEYIQNKGLDTIKKHAYDFIGSRLALAVIPNDGKQTPMRGHPVFIAEHATATCCRSCLYKWHHIPKNKKLNQDEIDYIVNIIMMWINNELSTQNNRNMNI